MLIDQTQAFALARREQLNRIGSGDLGFSHSGRQLRAPRAVRLLRPANFNRQATRAPAPETPLDYRIAAKNSDPPGV